LSEEKVVDKLIVHLLNIEQKKEMAGDGQCSKMETL